MDPVQQIATTLEPVLVGMGYSLVRVRLTGAARPVLQVMAERTDENPMTVEDCADISHAVSALLDVDDPISGPYRLEVSSPGIDRPLTRERDFERFVGYEAKIELREAIGQRRRFRGRIGSARNGVIRMKMGEDEVSIPFDKIQHAKLVLTDDLIKGSAAHTTRAGA